MSTRLAFSHNTYWLLMMTLMVTSTLMLMLGQGPVGSAVRSPAPPSPSPLSASIRFATVDVVIEIGTVPLAAWQVEFHGSIAGGEVRLVGIEGGEHAAFAQPAYYDPAALTIDNGRVILAAYSTNASSALPTGKTRIARLHVSIRGGEDQQAEFGVTLRIAANAVGQAIAGAHAAVLSTTSQHDKGS